MSQVVGLSSRCSALVHSFVTTTTKFSPTVSGYVYSAINANEATAKSTGSGAITSNSAGAFGSHTYSDLSGDEYQYEAAFVSYDTSSLNGLTILTATIELTNVSTGGGGNVDVRAYNFGASVNAADFHVPTETKIAGGTGLTSGTNILASVGTNLITAINKTGTTYLMFNVPTHASGSEAQGTATMVSWNLAQLVVTT